MTPSTPESLFLDGLPTGGRALLLGRVDPEWKSRLFRLGFETVSPAAERDLRLASWPRESLDGAWWEFESGRYSIDDLHRILNLLFPALRPKTGILSFQFSTLDLDPLAFRPLLRQCGFALERIAERETLCACLARRV